MLERTREFIQLANAMSFSKAAKELNMSQPSLRRHIAELESELGFMLFERNPLTLTTAGCHYLEGISTLINDVDSLTASCQSIAAGSR